MKRRKTGSAKPVNNELEGTPLRRAVFLDRDGTICEEVGYLNHERRFRLLPGVCAAIRRLNDCGIPVIVVTNQSGVARGHFPEKLVHQVHDLLVASLRRRGAYVDGIYYCPHKKDDGCKCRKPLPGMLQRAAREHNLELKGSWVVGDRYGDVQLAHGAGARGAMVLSGYGRGEYTWKSSTWKRKPDIVVENLADAVDVILRRWK